MPEYDGVTMGDAEGVPLWLAVDGVNYGACGMLEMIDPITGQRERERLAI